jgi:hypothetical protein
MTNRRQFRYSEKVIRQSLTGDGAKSEELRIKGLLALWQYNPELNREYGPDKQKELNSFTTSYRAKEAGFMAALAAQCIDKGFLTDSQKTALGRRLPRYADQLTELANLDGTKLVPIVPPDATEARAVGNEPLWFEAQEGTDGPFTTPAVFFARSRSSVKVRFILPITSGHSSHWIARKMITIRVPKDTDQQNPARAFVKMPRWMANKYKLPEDQALPENQIMEMTEGGSEIDLT